LNATAMTIDVRNWLWGPPATKMLSKQGQVVSM